MNFKNLCWKLNIMITNLFNTKENIKKFIGEFNINKNKFINIKSFLCF